MSVTMWLLEMAASPCSGRVVGWGRLGRGLVDGVADGLDVLELLVLELDAGALLHGQGEVDQVEGVEPEVLEARVGGDLVGRDVELLGEDLLEGGHDLVAGHRWFLLRVGVMVVDRRGRGPGAMVAGRARPVRGSRVVGWSGGVVWWGRLGSGAG
jgi:hypothetical protein